MKKNMGTTDKVIRGIVAVIILILYFTQVISGTLCLILLFVAAIMALTSIAGVCPLYAVFGISTLRKRKKDRK